jgi:hypothetical protein
MTACGKKGPPRPPILYLPAAPPVTAQERGRTAHLEVQIPTANTNGSRPAVIDRVLVYGYTGTADLTNLDKFFKKATLVASVPVAPAPRPDSDEAEGKSDDKKPAASPPPPSKFPAQGALLSISETITPALATPIPPDEDQKKREKKGDVELPATAVPLGGAPEEVPTRAYYVLGITARNRRGPLTKAVTVPLVPPPAAPGAPTVTFNETAITITWNPPAFVRRSVQQVFEAPAVPPPTVVEPVVPIASGTEPSPTASVFPPGQAPVIGTVVPILPPSTLLLSTPIGTSYAETAYNLYQLDPDAAAPKKLVADGDGDVVAGALSKPLNTAPLSVTTYTDTRMTWGTRRCYEVRAVDTYETMTVESEPSPMTCVSLKDTFPPAAPRSLQAVAAEGAISLIWEANTESDLAGYIVLRAEEHGALVPITPRPIHETTFRDTTVRAGQTYAYVVVAVDTARNRSAASNRVQETAR